MSALTIAYTPEYLDWRLGETHPTNPERARIAVDLLERWATDSETSLRMIRPTLDLERTLSEAALVHAPAYLESFARGVSGEWSGESTRLRDVASLMFGGTVALVDDLLARNEPGVWFNPQGAKHHAQADRSSGFCVLNDMAWAATMLVAEGRRVAYIDWDAHHGDGVEALLHDEPRALTASIHDGTIFPGTGFSSDPAAAVHNWPLPHGAGDEALEEAILDVIDLLDAHQPDVLLLACGADGLDADPLSSLRYSLDGIGFAAERVGHWAARRGVPVLVGGAGGYRPLDETPEAWALTVRTLHYEFERYEPVSFTTCFGMNQRGNR